MKKILTALFLMSAAGCAQTEMADDVAVQEGEILVDEDAQTDDFIVGIKCPGSPLCDMEPQLPTNPGPDCSGDHPTPCCGDLTPKPGCGAPGAGHKISDDPWRSLLKEFLLSNQSESITVDEYWPFPWPGPWPGPSNGGCATYRGADGKPAVICCTVDNHTICWPAAG